MTSLTSMKKNIKLSFYFILLHKSLLMCNLELGYKGCVTTVATGAMAPVKFWDSLVKGYVEGKNWYVDWSLAPVLVDF